MKGWDFAELTHSIPKFFGISPLKGITHHSKISCIKHRHKFTLFEISIPTHGHDNDRPYHPLTINHYSRVNPVNCVERTLGL